MRTLSPEIVTLREQGMSQAAIASRYGVSAVAVSRYLARRARGALSRQPSAVMSCEHCGEPVTVSGEKRQRIHHFCSQDCYHEWTVAGRPSRRSWRHGNRLARQLVAEHYGSLPKGSSIHHEDGDNRNNAISNLWLFATNGQHQSYHRGGSGRPIWRGDQR